LTDPRRILIVRLGSMGDIVHALPVLAAFRDRWPDAEVDWLVEARHAPFLDLVPGVTERVLLDSRRLGGERGWPAVVGRLRARRYDLAIDVQGLIKSAGLARLAGARETIGFARGHVREGPAAWFYTARVDPGPARHVIDRNLALATRAGASGAGRRFEIRVPAPGAATAAALDALGLRFIVLNAGGGWPNKRWPADRFAALAAHLHERCGLPSLAIWGPGERLLADAVAAPGPPAVSIAPTLSLADLVAILGRAALVVSGDSGPLHVAAALGTPVVGIYGPTDPIRNGPWAAGDRTVSRRDRCQCFHKRRCHAARWCLDDIGIAEVEEACLRRLGWSAAQVTA
jgi:lipopolysaccharide heptosyltransferase I